MTQQNSGCIKTRSEGDRHTILQVQETRLTNVLHLTAGLTDLRLLETHPCAGTPSEHSEGSSTDLKGINTKINTLVYNRRDCILFLFRLNKGKLW